MMPEDPNAYMRNRIERHVVGKCVESFVIEGRKCIITFEGGARATFTVVEDFELKWSGWVFEPNRNPGRPKNTA